MPDTTPALAAPPPGPLTVDTLPCRSLDCRHERHHQGEPCMSEPPCRLWPGDTDCAGCLGNGWYLDIEGARAKVATP